MSEEKYKVDENLAAQLKDQLEGLRGDITHKAHHLVNVIMPQRVLHLSELYNVCCFRHHHHHVIITHRNDT